MLEDIENCSWLCRRSPGVRAGQDKTLEDTGHCPNILLSPPPTLGPNKNKNKTAHAWVLSCVLKCFPLPQPQYFYTCMGNVLCSPTFYSPLLQPQGFSHSWVTSSVLRHFLPCSDPNASPHAWAMSCVLRHFTLPFTDPNASLQA